MHSKHFNKFLGVSIVHCENEKLPLRTYRKIPSSPGDAISIHCKKRRESMVQYAQSLHFNADLLSERNNFQGPVTAV